MKKLLCLLLIVSTNSIAITVDDLGYKSIFRTFYPSIFRVHMDDNDYEGNGLPKAAIKDDGKEYLALMHVPQEYKNALGEDRFLVLVEKREIAKNEFMLVNGSLKKIDSFYYGFTNTCHACYSNIDLKIFKKINNKYELVSINLPNSKSTGGYGVSDLDISNLADKVKLIGKSKVGFFNISTDYSYGTETKNLNLIVLDENQIKDYYLDVVGSDDSGNFAEMSPLSHTLTSEWYFDDSNEVNSYFPVKIKKDN